MTKTDSHTWDALLNLDSVPPERFVALGKAIRECPATAHELERKVECSPLDRQRQSSLDEMADAYLGYHRNTGPAHQRRHAKLRDGVLESIVECLSDELTTSAAMTQLHVARARTAERLRAHKKIIAQFEAAMRAFECAS
jgi:hypothetical protein